MFSKRLKLAGLGLLALTALTMVGCQSKESSQAVSAETKAAKCDKCQTVWVSTPQQQGKFVTISTTKSMKCPECKSAAANFFETGKFAHACTACGGQIEKCDVHN